MNKKAYYGQFGGQYVAESLMNTLQELDQAYVAVSLLSETVCRQRDTALLCRASVCKIRYKNLFKA